MGELQGRVRYKYCAFVEISTDFVFDVHGKERELGIERNNNQIDLILLSFGNYAVDFAGVGIKKDV